MHRVALPCRALVLVPAIAALLAGASGRANAQPPGATPPPVAGAPAAGAPAVGAAPPAIEINDAMLTPVPPAPKVLSNWKQALGFIQSRSTDLAIAIQEVEKAEGSVRVALAGALPSLTGSLNVTGQIITPGAAGPAQPIPVVINGVTTMVTFPSGLGSSGSPANPTVLASLVASQPILAPRAWYAIRTAEINAAGTKLTVEDKKRTLFTGVASAIIGVFTAERTADINRNGLKSALSVLDLTKRQARIGTATKLDVLRAEQSTATARATLLNGDEALRQSREALGIALGFPEAFGVPQTISLDEIEGTLKNVCAPSPLEDRADIKKLRNDVDLARRGINDVWLQFSPTASISSTASLSGTTQPQSGHVGAWNIVGLLTVPFWEGGARYGNLRIARAQHEEAKLLLEAATRSANVQIAQALRGVAVAEQERAVSEGGRNLAKELAQLTMHAYQLGTATNFDLVNTEQTWRTAELDLVVKEFSVVQSKLAAVLAKSNCNY